MVEPVFEIFKDKEGKFRFRLKAENQEIIAASQGYSSKQSCRKGIDSIKNNASDADVVEEGEDEIKIWEKGIHKVDTVTIGIVLLVVAVGFLAVLMSAF